MDNKLFNVNGIRKDLFIQTVKLCAINNGHDFENKEPLVKGWRIDKYRGFILLAWVYGKDDQSFPFPLTVDSAADIVWQWLTTPESTNITLDGWDEDLQHDGSNAKGWRVYLEDWGKIDGNNNAICAIKPAYMWYGK